MKVLVGFFPCQIREYNFKEEEYTAWSRRLEAQGVHPQWLRRTSKIKHLTYYHLDPSLIILADEQLLCLIDKKKVVSTVSEQRVNFSAARLTI